MPSAAACCSLPRVACLAAFHVYGGLQPSARAHVRPQSRIPLLLILTQLSLLEEMLPVSMGGSAQTSELKAMPPAWKLIHSIILQSQQ